MSASTVSTYRPVMPPRSLTGRGVTTPSGSSGSPPSSAPGLINTSPRSTTSTNPDNSSRTFFTMVEPGINSAIARGLFRQVRFLVQFGADVNERDTEGKTPLVHCALVDSDPWAVGLARVLVEKGASVGMRDRNGLNALHYAAIYNRPALLDVYLGAVDFNLNQGDRLGNTALHYAVSVGNGVTVEKLVKALQRYELPLDVLNKKGVTPLMQAYKCNNADCAALLISSGVNGNPCATLPDLSEQRTAMDVRNERIAQLEQKAHLAANSVTPNSNKALPPSARVRVLVTAQGGTSSGNRPKTCTSNSRSRPVSAKVLAITQRLTSGQRPPTGSHSKLARRRSSSTDKENVEVDLETDILNGPKNPDRMIRAASASDLRNRPELVFNMNPIECLLHNTMSHPQIRRQMPSSATPTAAVPPIGHTTVTAANNANIPATSWRYEMGKLYGSFEFQFTPSFVAGVKPQPPEPEPTDDSASLRPSSAQGESITESMSDIASICSKRSVGRRASNISMLGGGKGGRGQNLGAKGKRQLQALLTLRGDSDTSSTDTSISSGSSRRRKESPDTNSSDTSGSGKKGKGRLGALMEPIAAVRCLGGGKGSTSSQSSS